MTDKKANNLEQMLRDYLSRTISDSENLTIDRFEQVLGGASRITYLVTYSYKSKDEKVQQRAVLRMIPESGGFTSDNVEKEVKIFNALKDTKIPVPKILFWEEDASWLGGQFLIMEEVTGCESSLEGFLKEPYVSVRDRIAENCWSILGELAKLDPVELGLIAAEDVPDMEDVWRLEMEYIESNHRLSGEVNDPVQEMLIRWLKKNRPPAAQKLSVVHGDYRSGNFLYDEAGEIRLILDWELWRLGDPVFDLVYSTLPNFQDSDGNAGRLIPVKEAVAIWENSSGLKVNKESLKWYEAAFLAGGACMIATMRKEFFKGDGRELLTFFLALISPTVNNTRFREIFDIPAPTVKRLSDTNLKCGERIQEYLLLAARRFLTDFQKTVQDKNTARTLAIDGMTLNIVADRFENSVHYYVEDCKELESVLQNAAETYATGSLLEQINTVLNAPATTYRLSDLAHRNEMLCKVLIAVHAAVEEDESTSAKNVETNILQAISNRIERFSLAYNPFLGL